MNINGIRTQGVANIYASNGAKRVNNADTVVSKDRVEISELGRTLSMYDNSDLKIDNTAKIAELKEKIANGTYNVDAKLTAKSIMNAIKEGRKTNDK